MLARALAKDRAMLARALAKTLHHVSQRISQIPHHVSQRNEVKVHKKQNNALKVRTDIVNVHELILNVIQNAWNKHIPRFCKAFKAISTCTGT